MKVFDFLGRILWCFWIINRLLCSSLKTPVLNSALQEICNYFAPCLLKYFSVGKFLEGFWMEKKKNTLERFSRFMLFFVCYFFIIVDLTKLLLWWLFLSEDEWMHVFFQLVLAVSTFVSSSCDKGIKPQQDEIVVSFLHNMDTPH